MSRALITFSALVLALCHVAATPSQAVLVANWALDVDATDTTGNHNGSVVGGTVNFGQAGATPVTGLSSSYPNNGHIDVPHSSALNPDPQSGGSFTIQGWAKVTGGQGGFRSFITSRQDPGGPAASGPIIYAASNDTWQFWNGTSANNWDVSTGPAVQLNQWTHLAARFDASTNTKDFFVNGTLVDSDVRTNLEANGTFGTADFHIGSGADNGNSFFFQGQIDDVALYNEALSNADIERLRQVGVANFEMGMTPELITPTSVTLDASSEFFPVGNLIDNSGLSSVPTLADVHNVTHAAASGATAWTTNDPPPGGGDYFNSANAPDPVMTFLLGDTFDLESMVVWGYHFNSPNNNEAEEFLLEFSTDGGSTFGNAITVNHLRTAEASETLLFGQSFAANAVRVTMTDNHFGTPGAAGGDRVGLGEVKFVGKLVTVPEPTTATLGLIGLAGLMVRRRRVA